MDELTGFSPVARIAKTYAPQSLQVPASRADLVAQAAKIVEALWDAVDADLSPNVEVEILKQTGGETFCRISPWAPDGVTKTTANPGDWIAVDGATIRGLNAADYAAEFTKEIPVEWAATSTPPVVVVSEGLAATITVPQPTSANRPFRYVVNLTDYSTGRPPRPTQIEITPEAGARVTAPVTLRLDSQHLIDAHQYSATVTVHTQYEGVSATSEPTARFTAFDKPAEPPPTPAPPSEAELAAEVAKQAALEAEAAAKQSEAPS